MSKMTLRFSALFVWLTATSSLFAETADANAQLSFGSDSGTTADASATAPPAAKAKPATTSTGGWMSRHLPVNGMFELGTGLGILFPSANHNLQLERLAHQEINTAVEGFVRAAWLPLKFVGVEAEAAVGASTTEDDVQSYPWSMRAHALGQLPLWRITPFALVGFGRLGNVSNQIGADSDPLVHFGGGAKVFLTDNALMRLDIRDNLSQKNNASDGTLTHSPELMLGVSVTLGRPAQKQIETKVCAPEDTDGDGIVDLKDKCPAQAGEGRDGCPVADTDGDGVLDDADKCLNVPGVAPDGCPADTDGDGILNKDDQCPEDKGDAPTGCPAPKDSDGDGLIDPKDKCPKEPETKNGYEDTDGCPDVIPEKIKAFTGVIQGITFDNNKATIRPTSKPTLDQAAEVLKEYKALRVAISGHTDNAGTREKNVKLSKDRAESVKKYLVEQGVEETRIETRGAGPDEPVDTNATAGGKERNRRIEFKLVTGS